MKEPNRSHRARTLGLLVACFFLLCMSFCILYVTQYSGLCPTGDFFGRLNDMFYVLGETCGPYSADHLQAFLSRTQTVFPIYELSAGPLSGKFVPLYYYVDTGDEVYLTMDFTKEMTSGVRETVAFMRYGIGVRSTYGAFDGSRDVEVTWATLNTASTCNSKAFYPIAISNTPAQTCIIWSNNGYGYLMMSNLTIDETLMLINSLQEKKN